MATYNIKNQEDFNKVYSSATTKERGRLGYAFPEYYQNYQAQSITNYQNAMRSKWEEKVRQAERKVDKRIQEDVKEEYLKAIAGKPNKYFNPIKDQATRDKIAQYQANKNKQVTSKQLPPKQKYSNIQQMIANKAIQKGIDPSLALALVQRESSFNPNAKGDGGKSLGLFQIYTSAHPDYKGGLDPEANAEYGLNLLKGLLNQYNGDVDKALWAYNAGAGNVQKGILPASTKNYISNIKSNMSKFRGVQPTTQEYTNTSQTYPTQSQINYIDIQNLQNRLQGGGDINQDIQYLNLNQPALMGQRVASELNRLNPSNDYLNMVNTALKNTYDLASQAGGYGLQPQVQQTGEQNTMMNNIPPIRGYVDINNQMAPVPTPQDYSNILGVIRGYAPVDNQPQNIREDVIGDYLKVIQNLQGQQDTQGQQLLAQYQEAQRADQRQNYINQMINAFGAFGDNRPTSQTWVTAQGNPVIQHYSQARSVTPLPTDTSSNVDAFKNQVAIQGKTQQSNKNLLDAYRQAVSANEMSKVTGLPAGVFLDTDLYKTYAQYIQNPEIAQQAQFKREAGMEPIKLSSNLAVEALKNKGNVDVANINALAGLGRADVAGQYGLQNTLLNTQAQQNIAQNRMLLDAQIANMNSNTKLELARIAGANALQLAQLQDDLYSNNPVRIRNANAQIIQAASQAMILGGTPEQGYNYIDQILGRYGGGSINNPTPQTEIENYNNIWRD